MRSRSDCEKSRLNAEMREIAFPRPSARVNRVMTRCGWSRSRRRARMISGLE